MPRGLEKQIMVYSYNEILLGNIKKWTPDEWHNMEESHRHFPEWKKPDISEYRLYESIYMIF